MVSLLRIYDFFKADLHHLIDMAISLIQIASIGYDKITSEPGEENIFVYVVPFVDSSLSKPSLGKIHSPLTSSEIQKIYLKHKLSTTLEKLVYTQMVQRYYRFLNLIVEQIVEEDIKGIKAYPGIKEMIEKVKSKCDFASSDSLNKIPHLVQKKFDFDTKGKDKTGLIARYLGVDVPLSYQIEITKAISVRNCLEHNQGYVRQKDIDSTGVGKITLLDASTKEKQYTVGEEIQITIYELIKFKNILSDTSEELIPPCFSD